MKDYMKGYRKTETGSKNIKKANENYWIKKDKEFKAIQDG